MEDLKSKVILVTGVSSGIGLAAATALVDQGAQVFGVDLSPSPKTLGSNSRFAFYQCNLTQSSAIPDAVEACTAAFGDRIDVLLNVAGIMDHNSGVDTLEDEMWDRVIAVNLTAPVKLMREVVKLMKISGKGSIVNVSSKAGMSGAVAGIAYTASKHGLNVAWRFKDDGIRCNAICPGGVATNIFSVVDRTKLDKEASATMGPVHALGGIGTREITPPGDIANLLVFLASDMSREINGAIIPIDNAWSTV